MSVLKVLEKMTQEFEVAGSRSPRRDAELILSCALNCEPTELYGSKSSSCVDVLTPVQSLKIQKLSERRQRGESIAYILGYRDFYKSRFLVGPGVLVPRPETEHILEWSVEFYPVEKPLRILDLGCGSGCIGLSLLKEFSKSQLSAVDISQEALFYAKKNAGVLNLKDRVTWFLGSAQQFAEIHSGTQGFDLIVANPPYIDPMDPDVEPGVRLFEPSEALFSGDGGLEAIKEFSLSALSLLAPGGYFLMEIGGGQRLMLESWLRNQWREEIEVSFLKDYSGYHRICVVSWASQRGKGIEVSHG